MFTRVCLNHGHALDRDPDRKMFELGPFHGQILRSSVQQQRSYA